MAAPGSAVTRRVLIVIRRRKYYRQGGETMEVRQWNFDKKRPIQDICVDKTSCRHELEQGEQDQVKPPTEQLTKDSIRKNYEAEQRKAENANQK